MSNERSLIGSVFERSTPRTPATPSSRFTGSPGTGFPTAQHRFKSAFARARDEANSKGDLGDSRRADVPSVASHPSQRRAAVAPTSPTADSKPIPTDTDALLRQIHEENARTIAQMSDDEIEHEKRAIVERLGEGTGELLRRVQEARRRKEERERESQAQAELAEKPAQDVRGVVEGITKGDGARPTTERDDSRPVAAPTPRRVSDGLGAKPGVLRVKSLENIGRAVPSPLPPTSSTRPSSRTGRRLRFAEVTPNDVHVYESAPVSPRRPALALPPPPDAKDDSIVSLGAFHKHAIPSKRPLSADSPTEGQPFRLLKDGSEPDEGTPEYIRRRYFPNVPTNDPNLAWMEASSVQITDPSIPRFDLHGVPIPTSLSSSLPSHLGLHHHAEGIHAGYTIDDIFLLARSTVPAQRASMLGILAKIAHRLGLQVRRVSSPGDIAVFVGLEAEFRRRILAAGLAAIDQIGSLGARAVEVVWECLVGWDASMGELEGIEFALAPDIVSSLQLDFLLPQIADVLLQAVLPSESLGQLLSILHWLAQQSNQVAEMIITTPRLVRAILETFLLTPIPLKEESVLPNPLALQTLITVASASRSNASALLDPADALLRFVSILPPSSPYPPPLATTLLTYTLQFYATLASYGLYSHIATSASQIFTDLASYILTGLPPSDGSKNASELASRQLRINWASLVQAWIACATDPHATTPPHEILWSQVCAWGWPADARKLRQGLGNETSAWPLYIAMWDSESAWLEGARINGIKGGEGEREEALQILRGAFSTNEGIEVGIVLRAVEVMQRDLRAGDPTTIQDAERVLKSLASATSILASALRLWLACLPLLDGASLLSPPFTLPLSELSALSAMLAKHSVWTLPSTLGAMHLRVYLRPPTNFVVYFHRVSRHIPGTTPQLWFAQALVFLSLLLPGDEPCALTMLDTFSLVTPQFVGIDPDGLPQNIHMDMLQPFFAYAIWPEREVYVAPLRPTWESISRCSTLRLPPPLSNSTQGPSSGDNDDASGHLARTFVAGLPLTRDFLFTPLTHLLRSGTSPVFRALPDKWSASEVDVVRATLLLAYAARRVMAAHGLEGLVYSAAEVVFACMRVCMLEHGVGAGAESGSDTEVFRDPTVERLMGWLLEPFTVRAPAPPRALTLEDASAPYLGATPFYQFYTDLVGLYAAVSFGHRTFAALVVTPLAMHYPIDYRRALWCGGDGVGTGSGAASDLGGGLGDVVRSVRLQIEDVVCTGTGGGPREYLYPVERDVGVLGAYAAALVTREGGGVQGFLRLVAVHHVACTMWADLGAAGDEMGTETTRREETRARLLRAVLVRGEADVVKDLVLYRQRRDSEGAFVWPPACYRGGDDEDMDRGTARWRGERLAFVRRVMGGSAAERVGALLTRSA